MTENGHRSTSVERAAAGPARLADRALATPSVAVIVVTWNRAGEVSRAIDALASQDFDMARVDLVVVDNASTDGTSDRLAEALRPERIVDNPTDRADRPQFTDADAPTGGNLAGFRSVTIVRNRHNLGGCGGFNTGLTFVADRLDDAGEGIDYVWLADDDADFPPDALDQLVSCAQADPSIGIVGSRMVDVVDRTTTRETTVYFDDRRGWMDPQPAPGHRLYDAFARDQQARVREVDIVAACSLLARWDAVRKVGFWDARYFIYCDDADWCLRFVRAGYRVVCNLDAVVFHTTWLQKLTPVRGYYAQRNLLWLMQKAVPPRHLRRAMLRRVGSMLLQSRKAASHCRLYHAEIIRRSAHDAATNRGGRLDAEGPDPAPVLDALRRARALHDRAEVLVMCTRPGLVELADRFRGVVRDALADADRLADQPRWTYVVQAGARDPTRRPDGRSPRRVVFRPNRWSKFRAQIPYLAAPPDVVVVFDQSNEFPLIRSRHNLHVERKDLTVGRLERDGLLPRARFAARWLATAAIATWFALTVRPHVPTGRYG